MFFKGCESRGMVSCDGARCIPGRYICDGENDCDDGSDEALCEEINDRRNYFVICFVVSFFFLLKIPLKVVI